MAFIGSTLCGIGLLGSCVGFTFFGLFPNTPDCIAFIKFACNCERSGVAPWILKSKEVSNSSLAFLTPKIESLISSKVFFRGLKWLTIKLAAKINPLTILPWGVRFINTWATNLIAGKNLPKKNFLRKAKAFTNLPAIDIIGPNTAANPATCNAPSFCSSENLLKNFVKLLKPLAKLLAKGISWTPNSAATSSKSFLTFTNWLDKEPDVSSIFPTALALCFKANSKVSWALVILSNSLTFKPFCSA